jgi:copper chaperone CopZ
MNIMRKRLLPVLYGLFCVVITIQLTGCGTLMYPERRGQKGGRIDVGVAVLDGVGLLFFLVPGIIAYAIDFSEGTIYLPGGSLSRLDVKNIKQVKFDPKKVSLAGIEKIIKDETGYGVTFDQADIRITKLKSTDEMREQFAKVLSEQRDNRLSLVY